MESSCERCIPSHHPCGGNLSHDRDGNESTTTNTEAHTTAATTTASKPENFFLDNIIVGYAFGPKKMETMGLIMAEASKALSTFECSGTLASMMGRRSQQQQQQLQQQQQNLNDAAEHFLEESSLVTSTAEISMLPGHVGAYESGMDVDKEPMPTAGAAYYFSDNDEDTRSLSSTYTRASGRSSQHRGGGGSSHVNGIQLTFVPDSSGFIHLVRTDEGESVTGLSVTTSATALASFPKAGGSSAVSLSSSSLSRDRNESPFKPGSNASSAHAKAGGKQLRNCSSHSSHSWRSCGGSSLAHRSRNHHPIRVSFVPVDLDTPLEEQHGGKFDVILHKMTEDILCMSKMLRSRAGSASLENEEGVEDLIQTTTAAVKTTTTTTTTTTKGDDVDKVCANDLTDLFSATPDMTRSQSRASRRLQRLREYKQNTRPSCVLVDSPNNILAVMSRADMATVLSRCLAGVTTKGGIPVKTPRFRVVEEMNDQVGAAGAAASLADEIDRAGFSYPLIAKPLTAAGTRSSHHMGIVLARDGLARLKAPCLLQEYANHGETLFKVYVLGGSVWVFSRNSLPNLPLGDGRGDDASVDVAEGALATMPVLGEAKEARRRRGEVGDNASLPIWCPRKRPRTESYVEFERPAGSRCYVEFNSQRPYPKLSDFGLVASSNAAAERKRFNDKDAVMSEQCRTPRIGERPRSDDADATVLNGSSRGKEDGNQPSLPSQTKCDNKCAVASANPKLASCVTTEEIEPVTAALREAFGLELFGFDILVKHNNPNGLSKSSDGRSSNDGAGDEDKEILVVDVNYFPGYKEVPKFPSLLAQYLTQKAIESRLRNHFDGA